MDRRGFISGITAGLLTMPLAAEAQETAKVPRIGLLISSLAANPHLRAAFLQGLRDLGYVDGRNVVIEYRSAEGKFEQLSALVAELVHCPLNSGPTLGDIFWVAWGNNEGIGK